MLTLESLRKYKRFHKLRIKPTLNKAELVKVVTEHFQAEPAATAAVGAAPEAHNLTMDEERVIDAFVMAVRQHRSAGHVAEKQHGDKAHKRARGGAGVSKGTSKKKKKKKGGRRKGPSPPSSPPSSASGGS